LLARFETADKLSDADRQTIIQMADAALMSFQPKPTSQVQEQEQEQEQEAKAPQAGAQDEASS